MDALTSLGIDWKLLVAQIVNFLILLFLLKKFLYQPILKMLGERKQKIDKGLKDSEEAEKRLAETEIKTKDLIAKASQEAQKIVNETRKEVEKNSVVILDHAKQKSDEIVAKAKEQAEAEKEKIVNSAKSELAAIVELSVEKILASSKDDLKAEIKKIK